MQSSGTQLFLHLMRYLPSSVKTKSAYISSGFRPVKLVVTSFRLCSDAKREFSSPLHKIRYFFCHFYNTFMNKINIMRCFVRKNSCSKPAEGSVTNWLLFKTGCVQCILITDIKCHSFNDLINTSDFDCLPFHGKWN